MQLSELIIALQAVLAKDGDMNVYCGDMRAPEAAVEEPCFEEDQPKYGKTYVFIKES